MPQFGLALGGGGARGLAHIGVLKVLDEEYIKVDAITGCSMGSIVGGLYAYFGNAKQVEEFIREAVKRPVMMHLGIDKLNGRGTLPDKNYFEQFFDYVGTRIQALKALHSLSYFDETITEDIFRILPDVPIENLKVKFSAIATDLLSGEEITFTKGSLREALKASSAIPGLFPPVKYRNYFLVDGSSSESVPAGKVRDLGADRVLGVDVTRSIDTIERPQNIVDILYRTEDITSYHLSVQRLHEADLVIRPNVQHLTWADFDKTGEIISAGYNIARGNLKEIKKLLRRNTYLLEIKRHLNVLLADR